LVPLAAILGTASGATASGLGDPFVVSSLTLSAADDPASEPTPVDRDTDAVYNGVDLVLSNVAVRGDVTGLPSTLAGCDVSLVDTGNEGFVLADVDADGQISAADVIQDDEAHGVNVNSGGNAPVFAIVSGSVVWVENADWTLSSYLDRGPACTGYDVAVSADGTPPPMPSLGRAWGALTNLSENGNIAQADLLFGASMSSAYVNDPGLGVIPGGIVGYHLVYDLSARSGTLTPLGGSCGNDVQCDDGLTCNGTETCNLSTLTCEPGTPVDCSALEAGCGAATCVEGTGCVVDPVPNGTPCDDGSFCTSGDACLDGQCVGASGAESDCDGYCDEHEIILGCNPLDGLIIPPQAIAYSGGRFPSGGETLITFAIPAGRDVVVSEDPSCAETGVCGAGGTCTAGKIGDPCSQGSDCSQPPFTCRIILNWSTAPDLQLIFAKLRGRPRVELDSLVLPLALGCARKIDLPIVQMPKRRRANFVIKVLGSEDGRRRRDRDRVRFLRDPRR
jgi:hypothetical protein